MSYFFPSRWIILHLMFCASVLTCMHPNNRLSRSTDHYCPSHFQEKCYVKLLLCTSHLVDNICPNYFFIGACKPKLHAPSSSSSLTAHNACIHFSQLTPADIKDVEFSMHLQSIVLWPNDHLSFYCNDNLSNFHIAIHSTGICSTSSLISFKVSFILYSSVLL